jgi:hypothetical protein
VIGTIIERIPVPPRPCAPLLGTVLVAFCRIVNPAKCNKRCSMMVDTHNSHILAVAVLQADRSNWCCVWHYTNFDRPACASNITEKHRKVAQFILHLLLSPKHNNHSPCGALLVFLWSVLCFLVVVVRRRFFSHNQTSTAWFNSAKQSGAPVALPFCRQGVIFCCDCRGEATCSVFFLFSGFVVWLHSFQVLEPCHVSIFSYL